MIGYYLLTDVYKEGADREAFWIPKVIAGVSFIKENGTKKIRYYHSPSVLEQISLAVSEGRIRRDDFLSQGWEIYECEVPDMYLKGLIEVCNKGDKEKIRQYSREILEYIREVAMETGSLEEDYSDYWWRKSKEWEWDPAEKEYEEDD